MAIKQRRKCLVLIICGIFFIGLFIAINFVQKLPHFHRYQLILDYEKVSGETNSPRTIVLWNSFFKKKRWELPDDTLGPSYFRDDLHCPVYHCELTNNHNFLPDIKMFDAVVFHTAEPFPLLNPIPKQRSPHQLYVFALVEPPGETKHVLSDENDFYNLTMTYRLDSDILWPYMYITDIENGAVVAPTKYPIWRQPPSVWNDTKVLKSWPEKLGTAVWFASNCKAFSKREELVRELQKYIDVDIYGKCGPLSCDIDSIECDRLLDEKYKFYLSFENSLCEDYVTEKLFRALKNNIIPVVFGGANYSQFIPPHSYINAEHFENVKELADYLKDLSKDPELYSRYFWWRRHYQLGYVSPFCDLCEKLHSITYQEKTQSYKNIEKWWLQQSCRSKAKIKF